MLNQLEGSFAGKEPGGPGEQIDHDPTMCPCSKGANGMLVPHSEALPAVERGDPLSPALSTGDHAGITPVANSAPPHRCLTPPPTQNRWRKYEKKKEKKNSWGEIVTGRLLTSYHHGQNRLKVREINVSCRLLLTD